MHRRLAKAQQKVKEVDRQFVNWFFSVLEEQAEDPRTTAGVQNLLGVLAWDIYSHCAASSLGKHCQKIDWALNICGFPKPTEQTDLQMHETTI